jgi:hypothetical protein
MFALRQATAVLHNAGSSCVCICKTNPEPTLMRRTVVKNWLMKHNNSTVQAQVTLLATLDSLYFACNTLPLCRTVTEAAATLQCPFPQQVPITTADGIY